MKKCPYCAEEIQDEAIVCRYCNRDLVIKDWPRKKTLKDNLTEDDAAGLVKNLTDAFLASYENMSKEVLLDINGRL